MVVAASFKDSLLYKSVPATAIPAADYTLMSAILEKAYDYNYSTTMYLVTIIGFCDLLLSWFSYF